MPGAGDELRIVMYPWFAMGHLTAFLHISNKLAKRGHQIFFILPKNTQSRLQHFNLSPDLITFVPITVPPVQDLPPGTETTADIPFSMSASLRRAMDLGKEEIQRLLEKLNPHFVFFDFSHWLPGIARRQGIKSVSYCTISPAAVGWLFRDEATVDDLMEPPPDFPASSGVKKLCKHHAVEIHRINNQEEIGSAMRFVERMIVAAEESDAIVFKSCREMEGKYLEFIEKRFKKPVFTSGPVLPELQSSIPANDNKWGKWLDQFLPKSVIFCAFGSEARLKRDQFQELILGLELTGRPFFAALKPPIGSATVEEALPGGFAERTKNRGVVHGPWVQQLMILSHPSVGCFVTHCGWGSLCEGLLNRCRLVLMPHRGDQLINSKVAGDDLRVGLEVEKGEEDEIYRRESVTRAVELAMDSSSEVSKEISHNHGAWRSFLLKKGLEDSYIDHLLLNLQSLLMN